jgi:hypothetical protein
VPTSPAAKPGPTRLLANTKHEMPRRPNERPSLCELCASPRLRCFEPFSGLSLMGVASIIHIRRGVRSLVNVQCSPEEFIDRWSQHIPDRYQHSVRYFGLFAPRSLRQTSAVVFALIGQKQSPRPKARPWADSIERDFGTNPLLDRMGERMKWVRRLRPQESRSA